MQPQTLPHGDAGDQSYATIAELLDTELRTSDGISLSLTQPMAIPGVPNGLSLPRPVQKQRYISPPLVQVNSSCAKGNCYLPPPEQGELLLSEFLHDFNSRLPIFAPDALISLYRDCYSGQHDEKPLAWVLVYGTMALSHRFRAMSLFACEDDTPRAEYYLGKALSKLPELLMGPQSLRLVQALICMVMLVETSSYCRRAPLIATTAARIAQDLEYNELPASKADDPPETREQYYVFWVAFALDCHMSVATQRPPTIRLADLSTPPPSDDIVDWWNPTDSPTDCEWRLNIFAQHCSLAVIEAEASEALLSAHARRRTPAENSSRYDPIALKFIAWQEGCELSKLAAHDVFKAMYRSDIVHCIMLEAAYFRSVYQFHAMESLVQFTEKIDVFIPEILGAMMGVTAPQCHAVARRLLKLISLLPQGNLSTTWGSIQAMVAAACTVISGYTASNAPQPEQQKAQDKGLCQNVLFALESAAECGVDPALGAAITFCREAFVRTFG